MRPGCGVESSLGPGCYDASSVPLAEGTGSGPASASSPRQAYFFCSASACSPSGLETCSATCGSGTTSESRVGVGRGGCSAFFQVSAGLVLASGPLGAKDQPEIPLPLARAGRQRSPAHNDTAVPQHIVSSPGPVGFEDSRGQEPTQGTSGTRALVARVP